MAGIEPTPPAGPAADARGMAALDPSENVKALNEAANKRQDDLRVMESTHLREMIAMRTNYETQLSAKESERIDAIRSVDVQAVQRAAEVAAAAVQALAAQVPITADAVRTSLAQALDPIQRDVIALRQAQYEQQGQKSATAEVRAGSGQSWVVAGIVMSGVLGVLGLLVAVASVIFVATR